MIPGTASGILLYPEKGANRLISLPSVMAYAIHLHAVKLILSLSDGHKKTSGGLTLLEVCYYVINLFSANLVISHNELK